MRRMGALAGVVLALGAAAAGPASASWRETRVEVVDPIHELLHHTYADALRARDRATLAPLFAAEADAAVLAPSLDLVAHFRHLDRVLVDIDTVDLEAVPVRARLRLTLEGERADGQRQTIVQDKEVLLEEGEAGWRIRADHPAPAEVVPVPRARFVDEAAARGLRFTHHVSETPDLHGTPQKYVFGSGAAVLDADDDGWEDVLLVSGGAIALFRNQGGTFTDVSRAWGLGEPFAGILTVALPADLDNDGDTDLFVAAEHAQPVVLRNDGTRFRRVAESGIRTTERTIGAVAADFDGDGRVDLFLANHEDVFREAPDPPGRAENAEPDQLYLNTGDLTFRDASGEAGIDNTGWSLAPAAADYDADGDVDLFVGNDFGTDVLYRNDGTGRFTEVARRAGVRLPVATMSADWGDYDADGDLDLFVGGMRSGSAWVLEVPDFPVDRVPRFVDWMFRSRVREAIRSWFRGNRFYENLGDGTFAEIGQESGAQNSGWAWGTVWLDLDNDGRLDLYGANGFISGPLEDDV